MSFAKFLRGRNKPVYISLGNACNVKYQINLHVKQTQETQFFDWLMTSFESVLQVLAESDIERLIHSGALTKTGDHSGKSVISFNKLQDCVSIHDLPSLYTPEQEAVCIQKYVRRQKRLIGLIRGGGPIYFIRDYGVSEEQATRFVAVVKAICPACRFALIILDNVAAHYQNHVMRLRLSEREKLPTDVAWHTSHRNWSELWSAISLLSLS